MSKHDKASGAGGQRTELHTQTAALCYRIRKKRVQVLLITSRRTKRWVIPKGWDDGDMPIHDGAAREAWEEAGVRGSVGPVSLGLYTYTKEAEKRSEVDRPCAVFVFPLKVSSLKGKYPEKGQRRRKWMSRKKAAARVWEPELAALIRNFDPAKL